MSTEEILKEIRKLPHNKKLLIIEKTLTSLKNENKNVLENAASDLLKDYKTDKNLTSFTKLDFEDFYETR